MTNTGLFKNLIDGYNEYSFTHEYIFGFTYKKNVYAVKATASELPYILILDKGSRGAGTLLRFKPNVEQKLYLLSLGATVICSADFFNHECDSNKYNRGENFERIITESYGQKWEKDHVPFWEDGDITVGKTAYQIKFEKATFISEKQLEKLDSGAC